MEVDTITTLFWEILTPGGAKMPTGELLEAINKILVHLKTLKKYFQMRQKLDLVQAGLGY